MKVPSGKVLAINGVLITLILGGVVVAGRSLLGPPPAEVCSKRYNVISTLAFEQAGSPLTAADLQAKASGRDIGILENVSFRLTNQGPAQAIMAVRIPALDSSAPRGISYPWAPKALNGKSSGCLSYSVFLSKDFQFGPGGSLPGLTGELPSQDEKEPATSARVWPMWTPTAGLNLAVRLRKGKDGNSVPVASEMFEMSRGRWISVEQEVVLNTPGSQNGLARLWVDGRLLIERKDLTLRRDPKMTLTGVAADIHYGESLDGLVQKAPKSATVWLSPLEVRTTN